MKNELLTRLKKYPTLLVASLDGDDLPYLLEQARTERADIVEIRLDLWGNFFREDMLEKMARFKAKIGLPMLVSFRGGHPFPAWWQPYHWRALSHASLIDVEWNPKYPWREIAKNTRRYHLALMISHHDYVSTPPEAKLFKLAQSAYSQKADIVKLATRVKTEADIRTLLGVCARLAARRPAAVMGIGPLGTASRLAAPAFQSCFIYGFIGTPTASGQLPFRELQERIRALYPSYDEGLQERQARLAGAAL